METAVGMTGYFQPINKNFDNASDPVPEQNSTPCVTRNNKFHVTKVLHTTR